MAPLVRNQVRNQVLNYVGHNPAPVRMAAIVEELHKNRPELRESEILSFVQAMIVTGKLRYAPGLKIERGPAAR